MPRYHFHLRDYGMVHRDLEGTELPDVKAARTHAERVAEELMRHSNFRTRNWSLRVEDELGEPKCDLFFADVDERLAKHPSVSRAAGSEICRQIGALTDLCCALRATLMESRILLARAKRKPYLVYASGKGRTPQALTKDGRPMRGLTLSA
jgi:hypothetical protein